MSISELCNNYLYSESSDSKRADAVSYLTAKIAHPDIGSIFDEKLGLAKYLFRVPVVNCLLSEKLIDNLLVPNGYDVLLLNYTNKKPDNIIAHTAFQTHKNNTLHVFSVEVGCEYRNQGLALYMQKEILKIARKKSIDMVRFGAGGKNVMTRICNDLARQENELNISYLKNNWFKIVY